jgi:putative SOS response-associated peptidase YedK
MDPFVDGLNVRDGRARNHAPSAHEGAPGHSPQPQTGEVSLGPLRWGLIPNWCADPTRGRRPINARCETVRDLPTFRQTSVRAEIAPTGRPLIWPRAGAGARACML